ncbi:hypothetical protein R9X47_28735 [Wukongibacter baidiensis]|uniref:hypothetical protein n=1 Tax=Wukongibacter baidiensis TaxID=1723361 RepID=UPI003D7F20A0
MLSNREKSILIIVVILAVVFIPLMFNIINYITEYEIIFNIFFPKGWKLLKVDLNKAIEIGDLIYYFATGLSIGITSIFSYMIYKASAKSNNLAEEIKRKEENRDREIVRENALILYYDLLLGLNDLKNLYINRRIYDSIPEPKKMLVREDFIKNVAILKNELSIDEMEKIYRLYSSL